MANAATTAAPRTKEIEISFGASTEKVKEGSKEHSFLTQEFDPLKKYMFELAVKNQERELPIMIIEGQRSRPMKHQDFNAYRNLTYTSQIVWNGQRRIVRYYDGCDTIFADKQPKEKEAIDVYINQTKRRAFLEGKFGCFGDEKMLLMYIMICSWNTESEFRTRTANSVFVPSNADRKVLAIEGKLDLIEEAMRSAREATDQKMMIHSAYLNLPTEDYDSGNLLTPKEMRALYREEASRNPKEFIDSYGNKAIEVKYFIDKALKDGVIHNKHNPNKATWGKSNSEICDVSGLKAQAAIAERLFEFSQLEEGSDFLVQLKALYS